MPQTFHRVAVFALGLAVGPAVTPAAIVTFNFPLTAYQETSGSDSSGSGIGTLTLDTTSKTILNVTISWTGLGDVTKVHFHRGSCCADGPLQLEIVPPAPPGGPCLTSPAVATNVVLTAAQVSELLARQWYVNIHTLEHPAGELRGQAYPQQNYTFTFPVNSSQETSGSTSPGTGLGVVTLDTTTNTLSADISWSGLAGTGSVTKVHFYRGRCGRDGPLQLEVVPPAPAGGPYITSPAVATNVPITPEQAADLLCGSWYLNIHTLAFPAGEIRGQAFVDGVHVISFSGDASQETSGSTSCGRSSAALTLDKTIPLAPRVSVGVSWTGLDAPPQVTRVHFHRGRFGADGPLQFEVVPPAPPGGPFINSPVSATTVPITLQQATDILCGLWYLNIHTNRWPSGEVRGQVVPLVSRLYVDAHVAGGAGDGTSWANAFPDLQDALERAAVLRSNCETPVQIWAARGIYIPREPPDVPTFTLARGVALFGGFASGDDEFCDRRPAANPTILEGGGLNAGPGPMPALHVVTTDGTDSTTRLDGFTIRGGAALGAAFPDTVGGGLINRAGGPLLHNLVIADNRAGQFGAGVYSENGDPQFRNCTFLRNVAGPGGMPGGDSLSGGGGGFFTVTGNPSLTRCTFIDNLAGIGAALFHSDSVEAAATLQPEGPAEGDAAFKVRVVDSVFLRNLANGYAGACALAGDAVLTNCLFSGNRAIDFDGGAVLTVFGTQTLTNCTFSANAAPAGQGGGVRDFAFGAGGLVATNCIFWNNIDAAGSGRPAQLTSGGTPVVTFSNIQDDVPADGDVFPGAANIDVNPLFFATYGDDLIAGTADDDARPTLLSPGVDAGNNNADTDAAAPGVQPLPALDLDGRPRRADVPQKPDTGAGAAPLVDHGPYENPDGAASDTPIAGCQTAKVISTFNHTDDWLGYSSAVSGDYALFGAPRLVNNGIYPNIGFAVVYRRQGVTWMQQAILGAADAALGDAFGFAAAIDGSYAVIGAPRDDDLGNDSGSVYVFKRTGSIWAQQAKLKPADGAAGDLFGISVALRGPYLLAGAPGDSDAGPASGSAYVFHRIGNTWTQQAKLTAEDAAAGDQFGNSVSLSGPRAVIGAYLDDTPTLNAGSAYVFTRTGTTWAQTARLTAIDAAANDRFGFAVSIHGNDLAVGAPLDDDGGVDAGSAYVFRRTDAGWALASKLLADDAATGDRFGSSLVMDAGALLIGAPNDTRTLTLLGAAYLFTVQSPVWVQRAKLVATDAAVNDTLGVSVGLASPWAVAGTPLADAPSQNSGAGYFYWVSRAPDCNENGTPDPCDIAAQISQDHNQDTRPDECFPVGCGSCPKDCYVNCGLLVQVGECVLFEADGGGLFRLEHPAGLHPGERVRVEGCLDAGCQSDCGEVDGCIEGNSIEFCPPDSCEACLHGCVDVCGVLVQGAECLLLLPLGKPPPSPEEPGGAEFIKAEHLGSFGPGDLVRVRGCLVPDCVHACEDQTICVVDNSIERCGPDLCATCPEDCVSGCGTLVQGPSCVLFGADDGGVFQLADLAGFGVGDRVSVQGCVTTCPSPCAGAVACLDPSAIFPCTPPPDEPCQSCPGDLDGNGLLDGRDIRQLVGCLLAGPPLGASCVCADMAPPGNPDGILDAQDVAQFVSALLAGADCTP